MFTRCGAGRVWWWVAGAAPPDGGEIRWGGAALSGPWPLGASRPGRRRAEGVRPGG